MEVRGGWWTDRIILEAITYTLWLAYVGVDKTLGSRTRSASV